jgi:hypothetical protein
MTFSLFSYEERDELSPVHQKSHCPNRTDHGYC